MKGLIPTAQHYEEALPSDSAEMKDCEARLQATEARIEKMKFRAMVQGYKLTFSSKHYLDEAKKHFEEKQLAKHPDAPKLKMKDLIFNSSIMRMLKNGGKTPS